MAIPFLSDISGKSATLAGTLSIGGGDSSTAQVALKGQQSLLSFVRGTSGDAQFFMSSDSARLYFSHTDIQSTNLILTLNQDKSATFAGSIALPTVTFTTLNGHTHINSSSSSLMIQATNIQAMGNLIPDSDSSKNLGASNRYWLHTYTDAITTTGNAVFGGNIEVQGSEIELGGNWIIKGTDGTYFQRIKTIDSSSTDPVDTFSFDVKNGSSASWKSLLVLDQHDDARFSGSATFAGNVIAPSFTGLLQGAVTGAPDATIWRVSGQYPDWGIFYDEGSPDLIQFKSGGVTKATISLDDGDYTGRKATFSGNINLGRNLVFDDAAGGINYITSATELNVGPTPSAHNATGYANVIYAGSPTAGTTNNIAGGHLWLAAGAGKGTGAGGDIIFRVAPVGSSGSTVNAYATALTISDDKSATFAGRISVGGSHTPTSQVHIKNTSGDNRGIKIENTVTTSYSELSLKAGREFRIGTGGSGTSANAANAFYVYDATAGGTAGHRFEISLDGDVQARRPRSNTAGDVALSLQPTDSTIHYGFRIDQATNSINLDRVDSAGQLLRVDASGNATFSGDQVRVDTAGGGFYLRNTSGTFRGAFHDNGTTTNIFGDGNGSTPAISIDSNNSTFAGDVVKAHEIITAGNQNSNNNSSGADGRYATGVLDLSNGGTPSYFRIATNIPFNLGGADFSVVIEGFRYGGRDPVSLQICWHIYPANTPYNHCVISNGGWSPVVKIAKNNTTDNLEILLESPGYWPKMFVRSVHSSNYEIGAYAKGWTWANGDFSSGYSVVTTVPYQSLSLGNGGINNGGAINGDTITGTTLTSTGNVNVNGGQIITPSGVNLALNPNTGLVSVGGVINTTGTGTNKFTGSLVLGTPSNGNAVNKLTIASGTNGDGIFLTGLGNANGMATGNYKAIDFQYSNTDASFQSAIRFVVVDSTVHGGQIEFFTDNSSGTNTKALTLDKSQNATFAGKINAKGGASISGFTAATINAFSTTVSANLFSALRIIDNTAASSYWDIGATGNASTLLNFYHNANTTPKISFTHTGGATFAGDVGMVTGHSSGKFAVMSTSVHGSYDFYNNGTSYLNGQTTIDDTLYLTGTQAQVILPEYRGVRLHDNTTQVAFDLPYFTNGTADLACDILLGNTTTNGIIELTLTSTYSHQNAVGEARFKWVVGLNTNGSIWYTPQLIERRITHQSSQIYVADPAWDSTNSRYYIRVYHKTSTGNAWEANIKYFSGAVAQNLQTNIGVTGLLTSTSTSATHPVGHYLSDQTGDMNLILESKAAGDPTLTLTSQTANRSGMINFQDQGVQMGQITYAHNGDVMEFYTGGTGASHKELTLNETTGATFRTNVTVNGLLKGPSSIVSVDNRLKIIGSNHQLNIGQWDTVSHRIEGDANRPVHITSYQGHVYLGTSGSTKLDVHNSGITVTGTIVKSGGTSGQFLMADGGISTHISPNGHLNMNDNNIDNVGDLDFTRSFPFNVAAKTYNSSNTTGYSTSGGSFDDWIKVAEFGEGEGTTYFNVKSAAHGTASFVISRGYWGSNAASITCTSSVYNANGSYANVRGIRVIREDNGSGGASSTYSIQLRICRTSAHSGYEIYCKAWGGGYNAVTGCLDFLASATTAVNDGTGHTVLAVIPDLASTSLDQLSTDYISLWAAKPIISESNIISKASISVEKDGGELVLTTTGSGHGSINTTDSKDLNLAAASGTVYVNNNFLPGATGVSLGSSGDRFSSVRTNYLDSAQSSTTDPVLRLTDSGVANYDVVFPDTSTYRLQTDTSSTKTFDVKNLGSGGFNLEVGGAISSSGGDLMLASGRLNVTGTGSVITHGTSWGTNLELKNTNDDVSPPILTFLKSPTSGHSTMADNDYVGFINFRADNDANQIHSWVELSSLATDVTDGSESSAFRIGTWGNGTEQANTIYASSHTNGPRVGIGTASPDKGLTVYAPVYSGIDIKTASGKIWEAEQWFGDEGYQGMYKATVKKIQFRADGDSYFNSGKLGVGTTSPDGALEVAGGTTLGLRLSNAGDSSAYDQVRMTYGGYNSGAPTVTLMPLTTPGSGNVFTTWHFANSNGISGTSNNHSNVVVDGNLNVGNAKGSGETILQIRNYDTALVDTNEIQNSIRMSGRYWSGSASQLVETRINSVHQLANGNGGSALTFMTQTGGSGVVEHMRVDRDGLIGIGTSTPHDFDGESRNLVIRGGVDDTVPTIGMTIATSGNQATNGRCAIRFADGISGTARYMGAIEYNHNGDQMSFRVAAAHKMSLTSAGNMLLGGSALNGAFGASNTVLAIKGSTSGGEGILQITGLGNNATDNVGRIDFHSQAEADPMAAIRCVRGNADDIGELEFYTNSGGSPTKALTIDTNQNAVFAGPVWISDYIYHTGDSGTKFGFSADDTFVVRNAGAVRFTVASNGDCTATGDVVAYSDERLKTNIKTLDGSKVYEMRGVSFTKDDKEGSGVIAQELEKIAPELVNSDSEYKAVAYGNITGYLIEAVKELKAEIEELKKQIK